MHCCDCTQQENYLPLEFHFNGPTLCILQGPRVFQVSIPRHISHRNLDLAQQGVLKTGLQQQQQQWHTKEELRICDIMKTIKLTQAGGIGLLLVSPHLTALAARV